MCKRRDIVAVEVGRHAGRKLRGMERDVSIHAGREPVVDVARFGIEQVVCLDGAIAGAPVLEVRVEP